MIRVNLLADPAADSGAYALLDVEFLGAVDVPPHVNRFEDLIVAVLDGELVVVVDGHRHVVEAGGHLRVPRGVPRRATARGPARALVLAIPAGIERLRDVLSDRRISRDDRAALLAAAGIHRVPAAW